MPDLAAPVRRGMDAGEVVMVVVITLAESAGGNGRSGVDGINAGMVESHGIEAGEHAEIRHHGGIVFTVAVAAGRDLVDDADMEMRTSVHNIPSR